MKLLYVYRRGPTWGNGHYTRFKNFKNNMGDFGIPITGVELAEKTNQVSINCISDCTAIIDDTFGKFSWSKKPKVPLVTIDFTTKWGRRLNILHGSSSINVTKLFLPKKAMNVAVVQGATDDHGSIPEIVNCFLRARNSLNISVFSTSLNPHLNNVSYLSVMDQNENVSLLIDDILFPHIWSYDLVVTGGGMTMLELQRGAKEKSVILFSKEKHEHETMQVHRFHSSVVKYIPYGEKFEFDMVNYPADNLTSSLNELLEYIK
jgi:hypothetical protein